MSATYDFLQGQGSVYDRAMDDFYRRLNARPKRPNAPTLTATSYVEDSGQTRTEITVNYASARPKVMDYIASWDTTESTSPTYERIRKFPHVIRPVPPGTTVSVDLSVERRHTGARSPFSTEATIVTPGDTTAPATPTGLTCVSNPYAQSITLQWNPNTEADFVRYNIYRGTSPGGTSLLSSAVFNSYEDLAGTPGTSYYYSVTAVDDSGNESAKSNETNCSIKSLGTIIVSPEKTSIQDPPASFATVSTQGVSIPAGTSQMTGPVKVRANALVSPPDVVSVRVVLTIGAATFTSSTATMNFASGTAGEDRDAYVTISGITTSGPGTLAYQWQNTTGSSHQLTTAPAWNAE